VHFDAPLEALGILRTDHPHYYRGAVAGESEAGFVARITANLEQLILREGPDTVAAFIAEPITGASGVIVPPAGYYEKVQAILDKYDILFWADEVITGFGRTGKLFGCDTMNIRQPDQMTFAKQLSSAYFPISASIIRGDIYEAMREPSAKVGIFGHGYTYSGHPAGCAAALKTLEIYERDNVYAHAARMGEYLQGRLAALRDHPNVGEVRGAGLIAAVELVADKAARTPAVDMAKRVTLLCQDNGLIVRNVAGCALAVCPPLVITRAQVDELVDKLTLSISQAT
jgi:adenosylmethionine-8-amino-7-oxononanoate aminotransferase